MDENDIKRVVEVTRGSRGIGKAMANAFTKNGDQVVIIGLNEEKMREAAKKTGSDCALVTG